VTRFEKELAELRGENVDWLWYLSLTLLSLAGVLWVIGMVIDLYYFIKDLFKYGSFTFKIKW